MELVADDDASDDDDGEIMTGGGKKLVDVGYRIFSGSMMLLTVYGGYLCSVRVYRYLQRRSHLRAEVERLALEDLKE
ncbi:unnamed protein product [Lampetra planeri]